MRSSETDEGMTRRSLLRRAAAGSGGVALAGYGSTQVPRLSPIGRAEAAVGLATVAAVGVAGVVGGTALGAHVWGNDSGIDEEEYQELVAEEVHNGLMQDGTRIAGEQANFFSQTSNVADLTVSAATQDAQTAAVNEILNGSDRSTVVQAASDAVTGYYATNQKNFLLHWDKIVGDIHAMLNTIDSTDALGFTDVFNMTTDYDHPPNAYKGGVSTISYTLLDGTTYEADSPNVGESGGANHKFDITMTGHNGSSINQIYLKPPDGGSEELMVDIANEYNGLWTEIQNQHDNAVSQAETVAGRMHDNWQDGTISREQLVAASDLAAISQEADNFAEANADLASLGLPISDPAVVIELEVPLEETTTTTSTTTDGNTTTSTTTTTTTEPETETRRYGGVLAMRNPPDGGLPIGSPIDPNALPGPVFFSYNRKNENGERVGAQVVLQDTFTIVKSEGDGDSVTFRNPVDRVEQTDLSIEEYVKAMQTYQSAEEEARNRQMEIVVNSGGGSGGGFLSGIADDTLFGVALVGGASLLGLELLDDY